MSHVSLFQLLYSIVVQKQHINNTKMNDHVYVSTKLYL